MTILHITNDYSGSSVYKNLIKELDEKGIVQIVYNPIRDSNRIGKNEIKFNTPNSEIIYSEILNYSFDRLFYRLKIKKIFKDIENNVDFSTIDFIHAHTWFSDGGAAYLINRKYNIPYLLSIRNTDLNIFYKYLVFERYFGKKILKESRLIILISVSYIKRIEKLSSLKKLWTDVCSNKAHVIPNGVDSFWLNNVSTNKKGLDLNNQINILYVGKFDKNKNVVNLLKAIIRLRDDFKLNVHLNLVGGGGNNENIILKMITERSGLFSYYGQINDFNELKVIYNQCHIFAMPSKRETFGLVYIEAMLQMLPILYTEGEGIDGFYRESIGEKISYFDENEIANKLELMIVKYKKYSIPISAITKNHNWKFIAAKYESLYELNFN